VYLQDNRSRQGKMEKSLISFATTYPGWEPSDTAKQLLMAVRLPLQIQTPTQTPELQSSHAAAQPHRHFANGFQHSSATGQPHQHTMNGFQHGHTVGRYSYTATGALRASHSCVGREALYCCTAASLHLRSSLEWVVRIRLARLPMKVNDVPLNCCVLQWSWQAASIIACMSC
jgi:hypothetical protein